MKVFVAGHQGLVGSEVVSQLKISGHQTIVATRDELDLRNRAAVNNFLNSNKPEAVILAAAVVGGIKANMERPVDFLSQNLQIQTNVIDAAHEAGVDKLIFLGSSCIYPKYAEQPIKESSLMTGTLEPTNQAYAIAKIAGVNLVQSYNLQHAHRWVSLMPTNVYGIRDDFVSEDSHVMPALVRKIVQAKAKGLNEVQLWGTGAPQREFIHASDLADAIVFVLTKMPIEHDLVNVGTKSEVTIFELASMVAEAAGYKGRIVFDDSMPDGTPRKVLDSSIIEGMGWTAKYSLNEGIQDMVYRFEQGLGQIIPN